MKKQSKRFALKRIGVAVLGTAFLFLHSGASMAADSNATAGGAGSAATGAGSSAAGAGSSAAGAGSSAAGAGTAAGGANAASTGGASGAATGAAAASSNNSSPASSQALQAGVQIVELNLQMLRDLGLDLKNIIKASGSLYDEVTIQPVTIMTQPEVVGRGMIINIPVGFTPTGAGPSPKKARVDMAMTQMRPIIQLLKSDTDEFEEGRRRLDISDDERKDLQPDFDKWTNLVNDVSSSLQKLETLTQAKPYDCGAIGHEASNIQQDTKKLDDVRRKVYKFIQKQGKKKKNA